MLATYLGHVAAVRGKRGIEFRAAPYGGTFD
jgi:hypothetical protein